jgi:hypothetical protein
MAGKIQWLSKNGRKNTVVVQKWQAKYSGCLKMAGKIQWLSKNGNENFKVILHQFWVKKIFH